jgi:predicted  nucleic acid-binding Zn-ribbon protein
MKLTIKWDDFSNQIDAFATEAESISEIENTIKTEQEFENVNTDIKNWSDRCYQFLKSSFDNERNEYASSFHYAKHDRFHIGNQKKDFHQIKKEAFEDFKVKISTLVYYKRILSISDAIIKPEIVELTN